MSSAPLTPSSGRRDPGRRERILRAAADLAARRGFHTVGLAEIGAEAGIVGSGVYRHFPSKDAILVALLEQIMDRLRTGASTILAGGGSDREIMSALVRDHVAVAASDRSVLAVYHREVHALPEAARRRLRRMQVHYIEDWVHALTPLRRDLSDSTLRVRVHGAIGAIQSSLFFHSGLPPAQLAAHLEGMAHACLGVDPDPDPTTPVEPSAEGSHGAAWRFRP